MPGAFTRLRVAAVLAAILTGASPVSAQCLGPTETAARLGSLASSNDAALAAAIANIDRGRGLTRVPIVPRAFEAPPRSLTRDPALQLVPGTRPPTRARLERRALPGAGVQVVLAASAYTFDPCSEPDIAPDAYVFVRTRAGRMIPLHVVYDDDAVPVASCECVGGCGIPAPRRWIAREYTIPVSSLREVGRIETLRVSRHVAMRPACQGIP